MIGANELPTFSNTLRAPSDSPIPFRTSLKACASFFRFSISAACAISSAEWTMRKLTILPGSLGLIQLFRVRLFIILTEQLAAYELPCASYNGHTQRDSFFPKRCSG